MPPIATKRKASSYPAQTKARNQNGRWKHVYGALDLGTNNCRLLIARPDANGFKVIDSFSRTVRLGEGLDRTGRLSNEAMDRTIEALKICRDKLSYRAVTRMRAIATEACRLALNGTGFIERIKRETGIAFEIVKASEEAKLAVAGCSTLLDRTTDAALIFDIGGGSTELVWLDLRSVSPKPNLRKDAEAIVAWTSLPYGVVNLSERYGGHDITGEQYLEMVALVRETLTGFDKADSLRPCFERGHVQMLGTSGTVTTLAGIYLGLERYDRSKVDGTWIEMKEMRKIIDRLVVLNYQQRCGEPCIGTTRADLVVAGCAILQAISELWDCQRLRIADRGLREGMLLALMDQADRENGSRSRHWSRRRGRRKYKKKQNAGSLHEAKSGDR